MKAAVPYIFAVLTAWTAWLEELPAQYFSSGQDPASYRWMQVKTDHARFVFPEQFQYEALRLIQGSDSLFNAVSYSMQHTPRRTSILLHTGDVISNGFVSWAPRRSEIYTTPPQDMEGNEWLQHVLLHEYRHIVQVDKLNQGITKVLSWAFGEQATGSVLGLYIPLWFLEGDAVAAETALSKAGRGRLPSFGAPLRAQLDYYGTYDYEKAYFGSYRDFVPNHYILGYHLITLPRLKYGKTLWPEAINRSARKPWSIRPVSSVVKAYSGMNLQEVYRNSMDELKGVWSGDPHNSSPGEAWVIPETKHYTSYRRPHLMPDGNVIAEKTGMDDIDRIVRISPEGKEEILATPGSWFRESMDARDNMVVWTERRAHPRWENKSWAEVQLMDLNTGRKYRIGKRGRYFSPAIRPGGEQVGLIRSYEDNAFAFLTLDLKSGKQELYRTENQSFSHWMYPAWHPDGLKAVVVAQYKDGKKTLLLIDLQKGIQPPLLEPGHADINYPVVSRDHVWFRGTYDGEDGIYRVGLDGSGLEKVASGKYGITDPWIDVDGRRLLFAELSPDGYRIKQADVSKLEMQKGTPPKNHWMKLADSLSMQVENAWERSKELTQYEFKRYRKFPNLFNFHSWAPLSINIDDRSVNPGASVFSQNLLSTSFIEAGYAWLQQEDRGEWYTRWQYQGWFPRITAEYRTSHRTSTGLTNEGQQREFGYREHRLRLGADLPLRYNHGPYYMGISPSAFVSHTLLRMDDDSPFRFRRDHTTSLDYRLYTYRRLKMGARDLQPKWAHLVELNYRHDPWYQGSGDIFAAEARFYFPGLFRHHGISVYGGYERKSSGQYDFSSFVNTPTGWIRHGEPEFWSLSADYRLPLFYPDFNLPGVIYVKRFKGAVFADVARGEYSTAAFDYSSYGAELRMDAHFFRFIAPVDIGYRLAWRPEIDDIAGEFLLGIDFSGF